MNQRIVLMIDSGAYSAFKLEGRVDLGQYIDFVKRNQEWIAHSISLDQIPGSGENKPELERAADISYRQHQVMKRAGLAPIPVLHENECLNWLRRYLDDGEPVIALGTFSKGRHANLWFDRCFRVLRDYPAVQVHGLGMSTPMALYRYPWTSVDSSTWFMQSRVHQIPCPLFRAGKPNYRLAYETIGLGKQRRGNHLDLLDPAARARLECYLASECGVTIGQCSTDVYGRWHIWIRYFNALAVSAQVNIYFVSGESNMRDHLIGNGAYHHLLSFYKLKATRTLKPYVTGLR